MTPAERIKIAMGARGMGVRALDRALGKKDGYTSCLLSRGSVPRQANMEAIAVALRTSIAWLVAGEGHMDDGAPDAPNVPAAPPVAPSPAAVRPQRMSLELRRIERDILRFQSSRSLELRRLHDRILETVREQIRAVADELDGQGEPSHPTSGVKP